MNKNKNEEERKNIEELSALLSYGAEHTEDHYGEVKEWANKAERMGEGGAYEKLVEAAELMKQAEKLIEEARGKLD